MSRVLTTLLSALALVLLSAAAAQARTYEVTARTDHKPDGCSASECTLREAVLAANKHGGAGASPASRASACSAAATASSS